MKWSLQRRSCHRATGLLWFVAWSVLMAASPVTHAQVEPIDLEPYVNGEQLTNQLVAAYGITISCTNNGGGEDAAVIFDSRVDSGYDGNPNDPDLEGPPRLNWDGGNIASTTVVGNLIIVQEHPDNSASNGVTVYDHPDDEAGGGEIYFELASNAAEIAFAFIDFESTEGSFVNFSDGGTNVAVPFSAFTNPASIFFTQGAERGDHTANLFNPMNATELGLQWFNRFSFELAGSGAITWITVVFTNQVGSIGDYVWLDANADGIQDPSEVGIPNVTISLWNDFQGNGVTDALDRVVSTTVTDTNGLYLFDGRGPGDYLVQVTDTNGVLTTYTLTGGTNPHALFLSEGEAYTNADFGYTPPGALGDFVWEDLDRDGLQEGGETGIVGVTVELYNASTNLVTNTTTAADGTYLFTNLFPGTYFVKFVAPTNFSFTLRDVGGDDTIDSDADLTTGFSGPVTVLGAATNDTVDAGLVRGAALGDFVWEDADGDGIQDFGELGVSNVVVELYDGATNLLSSTTTDVAGAYAFTNLAPGSYVVKFVAPGGYGLTTQDVGGDDSVDSDADVATGFAAPVSLSSGQTNNTIDAGLFAFSAIGDFVWLDDDEDGIQDGGETGLVGVVVRLYDASTNLLASTNTAADGSYLFPELEAGTYFVQFVRPTNYSITAQDAGGDAVDSDAEPGPGFTDAIALPAGTTNLTIDAGLIPVDPTHVVVADFGAVAADGGGVVYWETGVEIGTVGFLLERRTDGAFVPVTDGIIDALDGAPQGGRYEVPDAAAMAGATLTYRLTEIEASGRQRTYGPWTVSVQRAAKGGPVAVPTVDAEPLAAGYTAQAHSSPDAESRLVARAQAKAARAKEAGYSAQSSGVAVRAKIRVSEDGPILVSFASLATALGLSEADVAAKAGSAELALTSCGQPVPYVATAAGIVFVATRHETVYSGQNVYWVAAGPGEPMSILAGAAPTGTSLGLTFQDTAAFEQNLYALNALFSDQDADSWVWQSMGPTRVRTHTFTLSGVAAGGGELTVGMKGGSDTPNAYDHVMRVTLNSQELMEARWSGLDETNIVLTLPAGLLRAGDNTLTLAGVADPAIGGDKSYVDSYAVTYPRFYQAEDDRLAFSDGGHGKVTVTGFTSSDITVYDVTDGAPPQVVQGVSIGHDGSAYHATLNVSADHRYVATTTASVPFPDSVAGRPAEGSLRSETAGAAFLVVTLPDLMSAAERLVTYRATQGLSTMVLDVEEIYDDFNHGLVNPYAVRRFLQHGLWSWSERPQYVVIAAAGSYDFRDYWGKGDCLIPPVMVATEHGLFASDMPLSDLNGNGRPACAIGRLPAVSAVELNDMIDKIIAYESGGEWKQRDFVFADGADKAGDFPADSDSVAAKLPEGDSVAKAYCSETNSAANVRATLLAAIESGCRLANYKGHGTTTALADERLLKGTDISSLSNGSTPPVLAAMTCVIGRFGVPGYDCLAESCLASDRGFAAVLAPVGLVRNGDSHVLNEAFVRALFENEIGRLGDAMVWSFDRTLDAGVAASVVNVYQLLGDPATQVGPSVAGTPSPARHPMGYHAWREWAFAPVELGDAEVAGAAADADADGLANLTEFALAFDPRDGAGGDAFQAETRKGLWGGAEWRDFLVVTHRRRKGAVVTYSVETCQDLRQGWQDMSGRVQEVQTVDLDETTEEVQVQIIEPIPKTGPVFVRLKIEGNEQ